MSKRLLNIVAALMFALTIAVVAAPQAEAAAPLPDIDGHWAELQVEYMLSKDVVGGYPDGSFKPGNTITRAEFMKIINNSFGFTASEEKAFSDVTAADWFAPIIAKAVAAGYISGYPDGTMKPNANLSRQEAAVMIAKAAKLDLTDGDLSKFSDAATIAGWSKASIAACSKAGYINGYPDGTFQAVQSITRAEAIVIASKAMSKATIFKAAGTYGPEAGIETINGDVIIAVADANLQNTIITGNLLIAQNVGEGNVRLTNITVQGQTQINGGGANSIEFDGFNAEGDNPVIIYKTGVRIHCEGKTTITEVRLANGAWVTVEPGSTVRGVTVATGGQVTVAGAVESITVKDSNANLTLERGSVGSVNIEDGAEGAKVDVGASVSVGTVTINATGAVVNITGGATVNKVETNSEDATIAVESGATLKDFIANAAATVTGTGTINNATITSDGVTIELKPANTTVSSGLTATINNNPVSGTTTGGSTGGGGPSIPNVKATAIAITVDGEPVGGTVTNNTVTVDLSACQDADLLTAVSITAPTGSTLKLATVNDLTVTNNISNLSNITVGSILTGTDNPDISLGTLRSLFGNTLTITGTLACSGYNSSTVTLTITLSSSAAVDVTNDYLTFTDSGTSITAAIKPGMKDTLLKDIGIRNMLMTEVGQIPTTVMSISIDKTAEIQAAIAELARGTSWNDAVLGGLAGKSIEFTAGNGETYTMNFTL